MYNNKHLSPLFCLVVLCLCCTPLSLWATVSISPALVRVSLDKSRPAGQFIIKNIGDTEERFRISAKHFLYGPNGELQVVPPDKNSLAPWLKFNPKEFTLPAKSRRAVRFVIVPQGKLVANSEYWGSIELESLKTNEARSADDGAGRTMSIKVMTSVLVPIFATMGDIKYNAQLESIKIVPEVGKTGKRIEAQVNNQGRGSLIATVQYSILDASGEIVKEDIFGRSFILPESKRLFSRVIEGDDIPQGQYTVKVECNDSHLEAPLYKSMQYTW
jgi:hypothetical protein